MIPFYVILIQIIFITWYDDTIYLLFWRKVRPCTSISLCVRVCVNPFLWKNVYMVKFWSFRTSSSLSHMEITIFIICGSLKKDGIWVQRITFFWHQSFYVFSTEIHKNQPSFISRMADRIKTSEIWSSKTAKRALAKVVTFKFFRIRGINCRLTTIEDCLFKKNNCILVSPSRLSYLMITTSLVSLSPSSNTVSATCSANASGMMKAHLNLLMKKFSQPCESDVNANKLCSSSSALVNIHRKQSSG